MVSALIFQGWKLGREEGITLPLMLEYCINLPSVSPLILILPSDGHCLLPILYDPTVGYIFTDSLISTSKG